MIQEPTLFDQPRKHASHRMHRNSLDARGDMSAGPKCSSATTPAPTAR